MRIMVPVDGTSESEEAIAVAARLADDFGADMYLVRVVEVIDAFSPLRPEPDVAIRVNETTAYLHDLVRQRDLPSKTQCLVHPTDNVAKALIELAATRDIDLIVMTRHGRRGLQRWTQVSVWNRLVRAKVCPVLVVPSPAGEPSPRGRALEPQPFPEAGTAARVNGARGLIGW
jgi:nucleotide-binding universal stress UspA family protein